MSTPTHAADLAETPAAKSLGALRLAAAVGFVLFGAAFTVHSFIVSTQPWEPARTFPVSLEPGTDAAQEPTVDRMGDPGTCSEPIELSQMGPACIGCQLEMPSLKTSPLTAGQNEG